MGKVLPFRPKGVVFNKEAGSNVSLRPVAAFYADTQGRFEIVNSNWCSLTNCSRTDALGDGWLNAVHTDDRPFVAGEWRDAIKNEKFLSIEFRLACRKSSPVLFQALPQYDEDDYFTGHCGTLTALESLRRFGGTGSYASALTSGAQQGKEKNKEAGAEIQRLRQAIDLAGLYYFEHDLVAGTTYRSAPLRQLLGGNRNLAEMRAAIHPEDSPLMWESYNRAKSNRTLWMNDYRVRFAEIGLIRVKCQGLFTYDLAGDATSIFGFTMTASAWTAGLNASMAEVLVNIAKLVD